MPRGAWQATAHGVARVGHDLATKPSPPVGEDTEAQRNSLTHAKPHSGSTYLSWSDTVSLFSCPRLPAQGSPSRPASSESLPSSTSWRPQGLSRTFALFLGGLLRGLCWGAAVSKGTQ